MINQKVLKEFNKFIRQLYIECSKTIEENALIPKFIPIEFINKDKE